MRSYRSKLAIYHPNIPYRNISSEFYYDRLRITIHNTADYRANVKKYPNWYLYKVKLYGSYPLQDNIYGIKINGSTKTYEFPAGIKLGNTQLTEDQLEKLLELI